MAGKTTEPGDTSEPAASHGPSQQSQQTLNSLSHGAHLKQKRARSQLSCVPCRQGKLKCNRSHDPACDQCIKRNRESSCVYVPPPTKQKPTQNVKGRIRQLENLVVDLMNQQNTKPVQNGGENGPQDKRLKNSHGKGSSNGDAEMGPFSQPTPPSDSESSPQNQLSAVSSQDAQDEIEGATKPFGQMRISKDGISYVGETHWQAILDGISDLKRDLGEDDVDADETGGDFDDEAPASATLGNTFGTYLPPGTTALSASGGVLPGSNTGSGFMLGASTSFTREQLIAAIPDKKKADRLLSLWFNSPDPFKPIIHAPTFQDEYRRFWRNPKQTPTMWLGLLYSILSLAASFGLRDVDPASNSARAVLEEVTKYHTLSASAAVLADYTKPKQYTIECLILYAAGLRSNDAFVNVWLMIGLVVRLCLRMGYHRDPGNYPGISVFDGEMRRRVWAIISMIDCLISFQLGLPSMVKTIQSDTLPPRNLLDRDFNVNTTELPPSRGIDELTPSSYTRAKLRIVRIFTDVAELSHQTIPPSMDEMMELDRKLDEAKAAVPPLLQMPDISELVTDPAEQLMCRFNLDLLFLKTKMVLHRRYMEKPFAALTPQEQQMGIGRSRKIATSCALRVLQHHHTIYNASQPGGQLESVKWYMGSISTHDFLLAAMIICLEMSQQMGNNAVINPSGRLCPQLAAMMDALEKSQKIWSEASGRKRIPSQFVAKDDKSKGEHMFDETEKASRAMAVMLTKVKEFYPRQAEALAKYCNEQRTPGDGMDAIPATASGAELPPPHLYTTSGNPVDFGGIVSFHQWGLPSGFPADLDYSTAVPFTNSSNGTSYTQSDSSHTTPQQDTPGPDFQMIGDMLDMQGNLDWEMFDTGTITKHSGAGRAAHQQPSSWDNNAFPQGGSDTFQIGNALVGGSGTVDVLAGNVMVLGGTGPGSNTGGVGGGVAPSNQFPGSWMSFQDMDDIDFNMGELDTSPGPNASSAMGVFAQTHQAPMEDWAAGATI